MFALDLMEMAPGHRMVRIGFGQYDDCVFFRVDFWWYGLRIVLGPCDDE